MRILIDDEYTDEARRLLQAGFYMRGHCRENPVTGKIFAHGLDPLTAEAEAEAEANQGDVAELNKAALALVERPGT